MRTVASIGLIFLAGVSLTVTSRATSGESTSATRERPRVVVPASSDAGPSLWLASFGVAELTPDDGIAISTLHVRAVVVNTSRDRSWAVDASKARLDAVPASPVGPAFVNSNLPTLPIAIIDPGEEHMIDFYFPLPPELAARGGPTSFTLSWPVSTPDRVVRHAWFERSTVAPSIGDLARGAGWGLYWWFDPSYPWPTYYHRAGIATPRPPDRVVMTRPPRWDEPPPGLAPEQRPREAECDDW
jgi:hypothetical protein